MGGLRHDAREVEGEHLRLHDNLVVKVERGIEEMHGKYGSNRRMEKTKVRADMVAVRCLFDGRDTRPREQRRELYITLGTVCGSRYAVWC